MLVEKEVSRTPNAKNFVIVLRVSKTFSAQHLFNVDSLM
jgi:hypothetical protein